MPKVSDHKEAHLRRIIRDAMAVDPLISLQGIKRLLEQKTNHTNMDNRYVKKLADKVTSEMMVVADREKVEERITYLRERNRIICDELMRMAFPSATLIPQPQMIDRRKALEAIAKIEARQVKLEMDLGLFTRHLGTIDVDHRLKPMDETTLTSVMLTFKAWSTPPQMRKIEPVQTITVKSTNIPNEHTNTPRPAAPAPVRAQGTVIPTVRGAGLATAE